MARDDVTEGILEHYRSGLFVLGEAPHVFGRNEESHFGVFGIQETRLVSHEVFREVAFVDEEQILLTLALDAGVWGKKTSGSSGYDPRVPFTFRKNTTRTLALLPNGISCF